MKVWGHLQTLLERSPTFSIMDVLVGTETLFSFAYWVVVLFYFALLGRVAIVHRVTLIVSTTLVTIYICALQDSAKWGCEIGSAAVRSVRKRKSMCPLAYR